MTIRMGKSLVEEETRRAVETALGLGSEAAAAAADDGRLSGGLRRREWGPGDWFCIWGE